MSEGRMCETCRYVAKGHIYHCRRYPPVPFGPATQSPVWPAVSLNYWCGEWRERERDPMDVTQR